MCLRNSCWYVVSFVVGLVLTVTLGSLRMPQGPKTEAGEPAVSTLQQESGGKTPEAAKKEPAGQTAEAMVSDVDLQSLEILRALRDSWAKEGRKIVKDCKPEKVR